MKAYSKWLILVVALVSLLALTACAGEPSENTSGSNSSSNENGSDESANNSGDKIELDFWTFWGSETRRPIVQGIIDDFNESQDEIFVKHTYLPWGDVWTKSLASIAAGDPPDVIVQDLNSVRQRAEKKQNTNLAEFIAQEEGFEDKFFENTWSPMVYEGDPYGVPFDTDTYMLWWNKEVFEEAGLDPEQPPTTWAELEEMAAQIDKKNGDRYERIGFLPRYGAGFDIYMMNIDGQSFWDYENNEPIINQDTDVDAVQWIKDYESKYGQDVINGFTAEFGSETADPFIAGKIGMKISPGTFYTQIRDYGEGMEFGIAPLPEFEGYSGGNTTWGGGFNLEIPYGAEHPEASWEFIKYLTGIEGQTAWATQNFANVPNIEASELVAESSELTDVGRYVYNETVKNLENTIRTPVPLEAPDYLSLINPEIEKALLGDQGVQEALDKAQQAVLDLVESTK